MKFTMLPFPTVSWAKSCICLLSVWENCVGNEGIWVSDCSSLCVASYAQVLPVSAEEIAELTADAGCKASPLLCLSQDSLVDFLRPVRIQLPLPLGVTGQFILKIGEQEHCVENSKQQAGHFVWLNVNNQLALSAEAARYICVLGAGAVLRAEGSWSPAGQRWASQDQQCKLGELLWQIDFPAEPHVCLDCWVWYDGLERHFYKTGKCIVKKLWFLTGNSLKLIMKMMPPGIYFLFNFLLMDQVLSYCNLSVIIQLYVEPLWVLLWRASNQQ